MILEDREQFLMSKLHSKKEDISKEEASEMAEILINLFPRFKEANKEEVADKIYEVCQPSSEGNIFTLFKMFK